MTLIYAKITTIAPHLLYKVDFEAPVWRLRVDAEAGWLAVECRDADVLQTSFWTLEADTGKLLVENLAGLEHILGHGKRSCDPKAGSADGNSPSLLDLRKEQF